ncbi:YwbE family protein [Alkalihalobacillus sp. AL-G]|uniref:YwbE family protein n=1 Tax=Alkalihalobacillus sp. AL-G TaxID=2926399 RepID=UPI00272BA60B|nr:YwbE family protein [Alkalihalobacillus sp. AL-G]WLD93882.1 YwbE family protein [Alkalihalobacillus sp. AL-G]
MNGQNRKDITPGIEVNIVLKKDQRTGAKTRGTVKNILTNSKFHPHGIKVRLEDGQVGRVQDILSNNE